MGTQHKLTESELAELESIMKDYSKVTERWDSWCMTTFKHERPPRLIRMFDRKLVRVWTLFDHLIDAFDWRKVKHVQSK